MEREIIGHSNWYDFLKLLRHSIARQVFLEYGMFDPLLPKLWPFVEPFIVVRNQICNLFAHANHQNYTGPPFQCYMSVVRIAGLIWLVDSFWLSVLVK